ncbi:MAG: hypothetical protein QOD52_995, partial [Gaiellaceae bacterium]|nr:hypothetical protein [Gaiellaceae bacterium]
MSTRALKPYLLGLMLLGAVTYFGGGGTWASFSAETGNAGNSIASGTLTMSDTVTSACLSATASTNNNVNSACGAAVTFGNVAPGIAAKTAALTIANTGSIDASSFSIFGSYVNATLSTAVSAGPATSLTVKNLEGPIFAGHIVVLSSGANTQSFKATQSVAPPASPTTPVTFTVSAPDGSPATATATYPAPPSAVTTTVTDTSSNTDGTTTSTNNTDCYDKVTTVAGQGPTSTGVTVSKGDDLNFNPTLGNPFCSHAVLVLQETTGGRYYCWYGAGSPTDPILPATGEAASGLCAIPIVGVTLSGALSYPSTVTSLPIAPTTLNGSISAGDQIVVTSGSHTETFTAAPAANFLVGTTGVTSIPVTSQAVTTPAFPAGSTVVDQTASNAMNGDTASTITNFDTLHNSNGRIPLAPVTSSGSVNATAAVQLAHGDARTFLVGLYMPLPAGQNQNFLQGL